MSYPISLCTVNVHCRWIDGLDNIFLGNPIKKHLHLYLQYLEDLQKL